MLQQLFPVHRLSLRGVVVLVALVSTLPLASGLGFALGEIRSLMEQRVAQDLNLPLQRMEERFKSTIQRMSEVVMVLAASTINLDLPACQRRLQGALVELQHLANLFILNPNGDTICSGRPIAAGIKTRDRDYFQAAMRQRGAHIGAAVISRADGRPILPIAMAMPNTVAEGHVAVVTVRLDGILRYLGDDLQFADQIFTLWDDEGKILDRTGQVSFSRKQPVISFDAVRVKLDEGRDFFSNRDTEGVEGVHIIHRLKINDATLWLGIATPTDAVFSAVDALPRRTVPTLAGLTLLCLILARFVCLIGIERPLARIVAAAQPLARAGQSWTRIPLRLAPLGVLSHELCDLLHAAVARQHAARWETTPSGAGHDLDLPVEAGSLVRVGDGEATKT